jgi:hypothetical protein
LASRALVFEQGNHSKGVILKKIRNLSILNGKNYDYWCKQMTVVFEFQDVCNLCSDLGNWI